MRQRRCSLFLLLVAACLLCPAATAADLELQPPREAAPASVPAPASEPAAAEKKPDAAENNVFNPPDATCVEWTDGCRTCVKPSDGETACSNVGTACVAQAVRCTKR